MKKEFAEPILEIIHFTTEDVLAASSNWGEEDWSIKKELKVD